jgi:hypothetical protein
MAGHTERRSDNFPRIWKRFQLALQVLPRFVETANIRYTKRAAVACKVRRDQLIQSLPIPLIDCLDKGPNGIFVLLHH